MATPYITNADIASFLNIVLTTSGQAEVDSLITGLAGALDNYCNRNWRQVENNEITELFDANTDTFFVKYPGIDQIISVTIGGVPVPSQYLFNYDTYIKVWNWPIVWNLPNFIWYQGVEVIYTSLAYQLPDDLKQALIVWVAREYQASMDAGKKTTKVITGSVTAWFESDNIDMPKFVKLVADNYRLMAVDRR